MTALFVDNGLAFVAQRHHLYASGRDGWFYMVVPDWHRVWRGLPNGEKYSIRTWEAIAGGPTHYNVHLGTWPSFAKAAQACEIHMAQS